MIFEKYCRKNDEPSRWPNFNETRKKPEFIKILRKNRNYIISASKKR